MAEWWVIWIPFGLVTLVAFSFLFGVYCGSRDWRANANAWREYAMKLKREQEAQRDPP